MGICLPCLGGQADDYDQPSPVRSNLKSLMKCFFFLEPSKMNINFL